MSTSNTKCQICANDSHTAMECPILDSKCSKCNSKMELNPDLQGFVICSRRACVEFKTVAEVINMLNWKPPPPRSTENTPAPCFHCGETNHEAMRCEWKSKKCFEKDCPGSLYIRGANNINNFRFGQRYLQCEVCLRIDWLEDLIKERDRAFQVNNRKLMKIINDAKEKEKKRRGDM